MIYITSRESFRIQAVLLLANAVLTLVSPATPVSASEDVRPSLPKFITYGSWDDVRECQDPLSYLCGATKDDKCVSPKDFCDGVTSCDTAWDEKDCDKALPAYIKADKPMKTTRLYWISMSVAGCAKLCDNTPGCRGFSHHQLYKKCQIHTDKGDEASLSTKWTSYERTSPSEPESSRAARYLFDLAETSSVSPEVVQVRERRQAGHMKFSGSHRGAPDRSGLAQTRARTCGGQPVFYMPPTKLQATTRIVGGSEVPYGAFPWQAEIKVLEDGYRTHHCGGAVISQRHILTAAHCVVSHNKDDYMVILGDHDLDRQDPFESTFFIDKIIVHPGYDKATKKHDIAILKLRPSLRKQTTYNEKTRPVCLPSSVSPRAGTECVVTGWGLMNPNDDASLATSLRAAMVGIIAVEDCASDGVYGNKKNFNADGMMCAGYLRGGVDACKGDSGGPLACKINGKFQIMGVVSWGDSCAEANKPGVYTRVSQYVDWINSNMV